MPSAGLRAGFAIVCLLVACCASAGGSAPPAILVVGDSLSAAYKIPTEAGWVHLLAERLARRGYDYRVINASIPGDTTAGGLSRLSSALARAHPAIVILELGGNDGLQGLTLVEMQANLLRMISLAKKAGAKVLLVGVRLPPNYGAAYTRGFTAMFHKVAQQADVALVPELLAGVAEHRGEMQQNGLHPVAAAEPKLLDNVWPQLQGLLGKPALPATAVTR